MQFNESVAPLLLCLIVYTNAQKLPVLAVLIFTYPVSALLQQEFSCNNESSVQDRATKS